MNTNLDNAVAKRRIKALKASLQATVTRITAPKKPIVPLLRQFRVSAKNWNNANTPRVTEIVWAADRDEARKEFYAKFPKEEHKNLVITSHVYKITLPRLTAEASALFVCFVKDSGNWGGTPMIQAHSGPYGGDAKRQAGALVSLKKAGLCYTFQDDRCEFMAFTDYGRDVAAVHGVFLE